MQVYALRFMLTIYCCISRYKYNTGYTSETVSTCIISRYRYSKKQNKCSIWNLTNTRIKGFWSCMKTCLTKGMLQFHIKFRLLEHEVNLKFIYNFYAYQQVG